ncbi:MAG: tetratricopeptide repeat-containing sensor histidine kinase [Cyclobacteriaceae bacterium]|nr:tetratricopeptide repeat-containing sensor histidine kinase [Cyclobacteriaceae bacterium]
MMQLIRLNQTEHIDQSLVISKQALALAVKMGDSLHMVQFKRANGFIYRKLDSLSASIRELNEALLIAQRNNFDVELVKILNTLAIAYSLNGNHDKALDCHFKALTVNEKLGNIEELSITYNNIGFVYFKLEDYERALDYYKRSLDAKKAISSNYDLDRLLINMALCYNQLKQYKEAENHINQAIEICKSGCSSAVQIEAQFSLGVSLAEQNRAEEAIDHFQKSLQLAQTFGEKRFQIESLLNLSLVKEKENLKDEAINYLKQAEEIANGTNYTLSLIKVYKVFSKIYKDNKDFINSSKYQDMYIQLKDSIYSNELIQNLAKVQANFAERDNLKTIQEKNLSLELKQALIDKQNSQYFFIIAIAILVLLLAIVSLLATHRQQKASHEISKAKFVIEEKNQQLATQNKELDKRVRERTSDLLKSTLMLTQVNKELDNFLYKSSHDIRGPLMTFQGLCNLGLMETNDQVVRNILEKLLSHSDKMAKILGRLTTVGKINEAKITPEVIGFKDILDEIIKAKEKSSREKGVQVTYEIDSDDGKTITDRFLLEIVLENLIDNGIKFYNNSVRINPYVKVNVIQLALQTIIKVEDNGIGIVDVPSDTMFHMFMRASERSETSGVGLYLAKVCTDKLGGEIKMEKSTKDGTIFTVVLPSDVSSIIAKRKELEADLLRLEQEAMEDAKKMKTTV